jgi:glucose/mannose transport system substrate-binding protein
MDSLPKLFICLLLATFAACTHRDASAPPAQAYRPPSVEVMHWLSSAPDMAALNVIRNAFVARGGTWRDTPMPDAGGTGRAAVVARIMGGRPPDVFQFSLGSQLQELAQNQLIAAIPGDLPTWQAVFPASIEQVSRFNGQHVALPIDVRGENWLFYNEAVLRAAGLGVPKSWSEIMSAAVRLKQLGKTPLALGGQPWQERILFNAVLVGIGGRETYRRLYERLDQTVFDEPQMLSVFETFGALRDFTDAASPGRRWADTTKLLIRGDAAFQVMGDWAKDEIVAAGMTPGKQIGCILAPAPEPAFIMLVDVFVFAPTADPDTLGGQRLFARTVRDPQIQAEFSRRLGTLPARTDSPTDGFDLCSVRAMQVMRDAAAQLIDPGLVLSGGLSGAIDDVLSRFWHDRTQTPLQGRNQLRATLRAYN